MFLNRLERRGKVNEERRQAANCFSMTAWLKRLDLTFLPRYISFHTNTLKYTYFSFQFENSLGKLQVVTVKAPRQIIDVGVVSSIIIRIHLGVCGTYFQIGTF